MSEQLASQACEACRRLKRKCDKRLPACQLCIRLGKSCLYLKPLSDGSPSYAGAQRTALNINSRFPDLYFLDSNAFTKNRPDDLDQDTGLAHEIKAVLGADDAHDCIQAYFLEIDPWLPLLSKKLLRQDIASTNSSTSLLLLCAKLLSLRPTAQMDLDASYLAAKRFASLLESSRNISLRLLQCHILLSLYELGHGIFPAAYLTVGHAARLGIMIGLHNRSHAAQLMQPSSTWTLREEERRVWWAIYILERFVNVGTSGLVLATPEPSQGELLPWNDVIWASGDIGVNQPLFSSTQSAVTQLGPFARTCQAAHLLSRVIRHRDCHEDIDRRYRLEEAKQLHVLSEALVSNLDTVILDEHIVSLALCYSAQLILYSMYGCNEPEELNRPRLAAEMEMQQIALEGIKKVSFHGIRRIAHGSSTFLEAYALYHAASECAWFVREGARDGAEQCLQICVEALRAVGERWSVGGLYLRLLEKEGAIHT